MNAGIRMLVVPAMAVTVLLAACAGRPPVAVEAGTATCPQLTGSYCARGQRWEQGNTDIKTTYLPYTLGIASAPGWDTVDHVEIQGVDDGLLTIVLWAGDAEFARVELREPELMCGGDRVLLKMDKMMWSGGLELLAFGGSGGWRQFRRGDDGILRVEENRRETGAVFLVVPLVMHSDAQMQFPPTGEGGCE